VKKAILFSIIITFIVFKAFSQPFGIRFGMNLEELKTVATVIKELGKGNYAVLPDKKTSYFEKYQVILSHSYGVIFIGASGETIESDEYGSTIKSKAESVVKLLREVYGEPDIAKDILKEGSIWNTPRDWLTSVRKKERIYNFIWGNGLPNNIEAIALEIGFINSFSNQCFLQFRCYSKDWFKGYEEIKEDNPF